MREAFGVIEELHRQAAVEAQLVTDFRDCLLRRGGPGEVDRGVAGQRPGQQKRHDDDPGDDRQRGGETAQDDHRCCAIRS
jgi:hypothetical protein